MTPDERAAHWLRAVFLARQNAMTLRQMARDWPDSADKYNAEANEAYERALHYLRHARTFTEMARRNQHAKAA